MKYPGSPIPKDAPIKKVYHYTSLNSFFRIWLSKSLLFSDVHRMNDMLENNFSCCSNTLNLNAIDMYLRKRGEYKQISLNLDYDTYTLGCMSPVMWGHYGDSGKGVCIELDFEILKPRLTTSMLHNRIKYVKKLTCPSFAGNITEENAYHIIERNKDEVFFQKLNCWAYENEYRIVSRIDDALSIKDAISSIYLTKCHSKEAEMLMELLKNEENVSLEYVHSDITNGFTNEMLFRIDDVIQGKEIQDFNRSQIERINL